MQQNKLSQSISQKKQKFRKQIRSQQLQNYMRKIRNQVYDIQEYLTLKIITDFFYGIRNPYDQNSHANNKEQKIKQLAQLVDLANYGKLSAIITLAELFLNRLITIDMVESLPVQEDRQNKPYNNNNQGENLQNNKKNFKVQNDVMKVLKFTEKNNQGWLAVIRSLITIDYCSPDMIYYTLKTISKNKQRQAIDFGLQIIYSLVIQKRMIKIRQIFDCLAEQRQINQLPNKLVENFIYSLMNYSQEGNTKEQSNDIRYYSTKILVRCFQSSEVLQDIIIKIIPLNRIAEYLSGKFNTHSIWENTKALKMTNDLLVALKNTHLYNVQMSIQRLYGLIKKIFNELMIFSNQIYLKNNGLLGFKALQKQQLNDALSKHNKYEKQRLKFIEQGVYTMEIIIQNYLFTHDNISITTQLLQTLNIQLIFNYLYDSFIKQAQQLHNQLEEDYNLSEQEQCKMWIIENVTQLTQKLTNQILIVLENVTNQQMNYPKQMVNRFLSVQKIILLRFKQSSLDSIVSRYLPNQSYYSDVQI